MTLEPQFDTDEAYELYSGCPTLTFLIEDKEQSLPYHSFKHGIFEKDTIRVQFEAGELVIRGRHLQELWAHLQLQDVRLVKCNELVDNEDLQVVRIVWVEGK